MQNERPNRERNEDDTREEIDRFEDLLTKLAQVPIEEVREERRKWERERKEKWYVSGGKGSRGRTCRIDSRSLMLPVSSPTGARNVKRYRRRAQ